MNDVELPRWCQVFGCHRSIATYCPLCEGFYCLYHDQLTPERRHNCLRESADDDQELSARLRAREVWRS